MTFPLPLQPRCIATTGDRYCCSIAECAANAFEPRVAGDRRHRSGHESNLFRQAQWSADGTTLVTHNEDQMLRTFTLPQDLLDETRQPRSLAPYDVLTCATHVRAYALWPHYDVQDPFSTFVLSSQNDLPISLNNVLQYDTVHAKYRLVDRGTESYIAPSSLAFTRDGAHFVAGGTDKLFVFDTSRDGSGPIEEKKTAASRKARSLYSAQIPGCRGILIALAISLDGILAAGTISGDVALYASEGRGACITAFQLRSDTVRRGGYCSTGIMQVLWSPCGRYLYVAERQSDELLLYDIRGGRELGYLTGRNAKTTQGLGVGILPTAGGGHEVWAGGTDGVVRIWKNPAARDGLRGPDYQFQSHNDPVTSTTFHPGANLLATCSGTRSDASARFNTPMVSALPLSDSETSASEDSRTDSDKNSTYSECSLQAPRRQPDNTLKLWTI